ncbi:TraB/GumN family protein [Pseudobowmanella zhangzhouensis]|uniref:TraB/GumN family protein n=1 Tax=Pseudobowmanella zhangzhouensis TaxID=1537679 RepID=UPI00360C2496
MKTVLSTLSLLLFSAHLCAESPVWKVSKGEHSLYLGGTMHLLQKSDFPLPQAFENAYKNADIFVFEADEQELQQPDMQGKMMQMLTYQDGSTFRDKLSPETSQAVINFMTQRGMAVEQLLPFKPAMLAVILTIGESQRLGFGQQGVDSYFLGKARKESKQVAFLETPMQQLGFLASMGEGNEDAFMRYTLDDVENLLTTLAIVTSAWREGNFQRMDKDLLADMRQTFPQVYDVIIKNRNDAWMPTLQEYLTTDEIEFVMVGALHLSGPDGLLNQFLQLGYQLEEVH